MAALTTNPERKLRIIVGPSHFGQRLLRITARDPDGNERNILQTKDLNPDILIPLRTRELIFTDLPIGGEAVDVKGTLFAIKRNKDGQWTVDETLINEFREYMPNPVSSRSIRFTLANG